MGKEITTVADLIGEESCLNCFTYFGDYIFRLGPDGNPDEVIADNAGDDVCEECHSFGIRQSPDKDGTLQERNPETGRWEPV